MKSLRLAAVLLACTASLHLTPLAHAQETALPTLREVSGDRLLIGTAMTANELRDQPLTALIAKHFECVTAGNEMKPDHLQREKGKFTFERADAIVEYCQANNLEVIGHTLLWHEQTPKWMYHDEAGKPLPREQALENMKNHIEAVLKHYKGKVKGWDVVNEVINDAPNPYLRDTPARKAIGDDYILKAFEFAHKADPDVELYYNDYNIETDYKRERALRLVREIKSAGLRIDGVGIQGHWLLGSPPIAEIDRGLKAFADEGMKIMITEMDVDPLPRRRGAGADISATEAGGLDPYKNGLPDDVQQRLATRYGELFKVMTKYPQVTRITLWGTADSGSWLNNFPVRGRTNHPLLFDRKLQPKPAFHSVVEVLKSDTAQ